MNDMQNINSIRPLWEQNCSSSLIDQLRVAHIGGGDEEEKGKCSSTRRFPEEEDEDLLRESDERFVLFPIRYREVCPPYPF
jgi:ribonucleoside-diphosphate reductase subunit M2